MIKTIFCHIEYNKMEEVVVDFVLSKRLNKSNEMLKIKKRKFFCDNANNIVVNYYHITRYFQVKNVMIIK